MRLLFWYHQIICQSIESVSIKDPSCINIKINIWRKERYKKSIRRIWCSSLYHGLIIICLLLSIYAWRCWTFSIVNYINNDCGKWYRQSLHKTWTYVILTCRHMTWHLFGVDPPPREFKTLHIISTRFRHHKEKKDGYTRVFSSGRVFDHIL